MVKKAFWLSFVILWVVFSIGGLVPDAQAASNPPAEAAQAEFVPGEVIVGLQEGLQVQSLALPSGIQVAESSPQLAKLNTFVMKVPDGEEQQASQELQRAAGVVFAEPNYIVQADLIPDDPLWGANSYTSLGQWGPPDIQAPDAWDVTSGSNSVIVAIIDSGLDVNHPEFAGRVLPGYDYVDNDRNVTDTCGHGTHVTGIAAATGNNNTGIAGLDWAARILPLRVLGRDCKGSVSNVTKALVLAVDTYGARVINLSLGLASPSRLLEYGTYYAYERGAAIFAAAGNNFGGGGSVIYPARYPWVMAVGSVDVSNHHSYFSNSGPELDVVAPGQSILSTIPYSGSFYYQQVFSLTNRYGVLSGTSMATPHAAGAASLLAGRPGFDLPDKIYAALVQTAHDLGPTGFDEDMGHGLIQVDAALAFDPSSIQPPVSPVPAVEYDAYSSTRCNNIAYNWRAIESNSNQLFVPGDSGANLVTLPFTFNFGGRDFTQATVSANGMISFDGRPSNWPRYNFGDFYNQENFLIPLSRQGPSDGYSNWFLAPFWDNLNPSAGIDSVIYAQVLGSAPHREYVVEWYRVPIQENNTSTELTFQVVLFEGSNHILFQYQTLTGKNSEGNSATIGLEYNEGYSGIQYAYNQKGAASDKQAILFTPHTAGTTRQEPGCLYSTPVNNSGGFFDFSPFCIDIPAGLLTGPTHLNITLFPSFPPTPASYTNLNHFAEITLQPMPDPPLIPQPVVCYHYSPQDLIAAGGRPQNLFIAVFDAESLFWTKLPTAVDTRQHLLTAPIPHFSVFGVFSTPPENLPVTGATIGGDAQKDVPLLFIGLVLILAPLFVRRLWWRR